MILTSGRDVNGNKTVKVKVEGFQGFSIQTDWNLPLCHKTSFYANRLDCQEEVREYVRKYGKSTRRK